MKKYLGLACALAALAPAAGFADDAWYNGIYIGGGVGLGRIEASLVELGLLPMDSSGVVEPIENTTFKKSALTSNFYAGWRFARYFGIEGGYVRFYDVERQYCFVDDTGGCTERRGEQQGAVIPAISSSAWTVELPTKGWKLYAVGYLPFRGDAFDLFVKVGAYDWETDAAAYEKIVGGFVPPKLPLVPPTNEPVSRQLDGTDLAAGIGINLNHPSGVTVRSELEYYDIGEFDKSYLVSFSALYSF